MMSKFIEVHGKDNGMPVSVNVENIVAFETGDIALQAVGILKITESYDEVKAIIKDACVLIHKADPRLDDKSMEWDDFTDDLKGEIFWNDNARDWYKYDGMTEIPEGTKWLNFLGFDGKIYHIYPADLKAKPMYRMRQ